VLTQDEKAERFRALHEGDAFIIPNPWDAGSAKVFAALGFEALATTSSGFAFTLGRADGNATLEEVLAHIRVLDAATDLPVSADLENGYGPDPRDAANAIARAAEAGAVGGSIEDYDPGGRLYDLGHATERVVAAAEAARNAGFPFTLTARAENHIRGNPDLDDTIARPARRGRDQDGLRRRRPAGQRARAQGPVRPRDRRRGRDADQRRRRAHVGRDQRDGGGGAADPRRRRPVGADRGRADPRVAAGIAPGQRRPPPRP
jgi:phosphoenolpyruvate phosphomutase-like protein